MMGVWLLCFTSVVTNMADGMGALARPFYTGIFNENQRHPRSGEGTSCLSLFPNLCEHSMMERLVYDLGPRTRGGVRSTLP